MGRIYVLITVLTLSMNMQAQIKSPKHFSLGIGPSGLLDPITPSLNLITEISLEEELNLELTYGLDIIEETWTNWHPNPEGKHHEFKIGLKLEEELSKVYGEFNIILGIEYFGVVNYYKKSQGSYYKNDQKYSFSSAYVERRVNGIRFKLGPKFYFGPVALEFYCGVGIKNINVEYTVVRNARNISEEGFWRDFFLVDEDDGTRIRPDFNLGFKVAYCIFRS